MPWPSLKPVSDAWNYITSTPVSDMESDAYNFAANKIQDWKAAAAQRRQQEQDFWNTQLRPSSQTDFSGNLKRAAESVYNDPVGNINRAVGQELKGLVPGNPNTASPVGSYLASMVGGDSSANEGTGDVLARQNRIPDVEVGGVNLKPSIQQYVNATTDPVNYFNFMHPSSTSGADTAAALVPKGMWEDRIKAVKRGLDESVAKLDDPVKGQANADMIKQWMDLHPAMSAHTSEIKILSPKEWRKRGYEPAWNALAGGNPHGEVGMQTLKKNLANVRTGVTTPKYPMTEADYQRNLPFSVHIREGGHTSPEDLIDTLRHEYTHGAQRLGFTKDYYESSGDYKRTGPRYWTDPIEIGARASGAKAGFDMARMGMSGDLADRTMTAEERKAFPSTAQRYKGSLNEAANIANEENKKGSGRNIIQGLGDYISKKLLYTSEGKFKFAPGSLRPLIMNPEEAAMRARLQATGVGPKVFLPQKMTPDNIAINDPQAIKTLREQGKSWRQEPFNWAPWKKYSLGWLE